MVSISAPPDAAGSPAPIWGPVVSVIAVALANLLVWIGNENSWAHRHLFKWLPTIFFTTNRRKDVPRKQRPKTYWALDILDPNHLVQSNCLNTPLLLLVHLVTFLYAAVTIIIDLVVDYYKIGRCPSPNACPQGPYPEWLTYFTNWSLILLATAGLVAFANTLRHYLHERTAKRLYSQSLKRRPTPANGSTLAHDGQRIHVAQAAPTGAIAVQIPPVGSNRKGRPANSSWPTLTAAPSSDTIGAADRPATEISHDNSSITPTPATSAFAPTPATSTLATQVPAAVVIHQDRVHEQRATAGEAAADVEEGRDQGPSSTMRWEQHPLTRPREHWDGLSVAHLLLMETATSAAFFLTFWFWVGLVALVRQGFSTDVSTFMAHGGNVGMAALQVALTRLPIVSYHFQTLLWYGTLYLIFLWIYGARSGTWRYGLDWMRTRPVGAFLLLPLLCFLMFLIWYFVGKLREEAVCCGKKVAKKVWGDASG